MREQSTVDPAGCPVSGIRHANTGRSTMDTVKFVAFVLPQRQPSQAAAPYPAASHSKGEKTDDSIF
jgi:hypothetical protein